MAVVTARGDRTVATANVAVGATAIDGANVQPFVVAAGALPGGHTVFFLRRVDVPGYPLLALAAA
jgi:hypothetical protein